jgi:hypothetical protein
MKTIDTPPSVTDEVISEVRRHKRAIAEEFECDVVALGRALQKRQAGDPRFATIEGEQGGAQQPAARSESAPADESHPTS